MKRLTRIIIGVAAIAVIVGGMQNAAFAEKFRGHRAKNIIFMVPDGMGLSYVTAARIFAHGSDGPRLGFR